MKRTKRPQRPTSKRAKKSPPKQRVAHKTSRKAATRRAQHSVKLSKVIGAMRREGLSLTKAARRLKVSARVVVREAGSAIQRLPNGRYVARQTDRLVRVIRLPAIDGIRDVSVRNSKNASLIGEYWNAVHAYLARGDASQLDEFSGQHITTVEGERIPLLTDRAALDVLGSAGVLSFESMYAKAV